MVAFDLADFNGEWQDSLGNYVHVVRDGQRGTQVTLEKPDAGKKILLPLRKVNGQFVCGHYDFDVRGSSHSRIVWRDNRFPERITVWTPRFGEEKREDRRENRDRSPLRRPKKVLPMPLSGSKLSMATQESRGHDHHGSPEQSRSPRHAMIAPTTSPAVSSRGPPPSHELPPPTGWYGAAPADAELGPSYDAPPSASLAPLSGVREQASLIFGTATSSKAPPVTSRQALAGLRHVAKAPPGTSNAHSDWSHVLDVLEAAGKPTSQDATMHRHPVPGQHAASPPDAIGQPAPDSPVSDGSDDTAPPSPNPVEPGGNSHKALARAARAASKQEKEGWSEVLDLLTVASHGPEEKPLGTADVVPSSPTEPLQGSGHPPVQLPRQITEQLPDPLHLATQMPGPFVQPSASSSHPPSQHSGQLAEQPPGQIAELFSPFGLPQAAPPEMQSSEQERGQVLEEILARLRAVVGPTSGAALASAPWRQASQPQTATQSAAGVPAPKASPGISAGTTRAQSDTPATTGGLPSLGEQLLHGEANEEDLPDWARKTRASVSGNSTGAVVVAPRKVCDQPLEKFIRVFHLDQLAAECLRALQDDEAAFVIEHCQGRLTHARNPSAVVMTAIKSVAARVGRRYWGNRETSELEALLSAAGMGSVGAVPARRRADEQLQMFAGSPSPEVEADEASAIYGGAADADPYGGAANQDEEEEEEEEEERELDEVVDINDADEAEVDVNPEAKRRRTDGSLETSAVVELDLDDEDDDGDAMPGVVECEMEGDEDVSDLEDDGLFFVDTGGGS